MRELYQRGLCALLFSTALGLWGCQSHTPLDTLIRLDLGESFDPAHSEPGSVVFLKVRNNTPEDWHNNQFKIECRDTAGRIQVEKRERSEILGRQSQSWSVDDPFFGVESITFNTFFPRCISVKLTVTNDKGKTVAETVQLPEGHVGGTAIVSMAMKKTLTRPDGRVVWVRTDIPQQRK